MLQLKHIFTLSFTMMHLVQHLRKPGLFMKLPRSAWASPLFHIIFQKQFFPLSFGIRYLKSPLLWISKMVGVWIFSGTTLLDVIFISVFFPGHGSVAERNYHLQAKDKQTMMFWLQELQVGIMHCTYFLGKVFLWIIDLLKNPKFPWMTTEQ